MEGSEEKNPKSYKVRITSHALQNINEITGYIAYIQHEPLKALRIGDAIFKTIERIRKNPHIFHECHEIPTKNKIYRKATCLSWHIIYKIKTTEILILGIIHSHRRSSIIRSTAKIK